jgi:tetratricopeptide (TPR) repeat protein
VSVAVRAALVGLSLGLAACAPVPWSLSPDIDRDRLAESHRVKALGFEQKGDLRRALDEWKIALTIDPDDSEAREGRRRLEPRLAGAVATRVKLGHEALRRGATLEARRHFLAALALDPANRTAAAALRDEIGDVRFHAHTVARGDTLAVIAERYYGDRARADVIGEANQLQSNPRLNPGTRLRVPEIPGLPFRALAPADPVNEVGPSEANPHLTDARDAAERKEYEVALAAVDRLLESGLQPEWVDLKKAILYDYGRDRLEQTQYDDAYRTLSQLAKLDPKYRDTPVLLGQARTGAMQMHYHEGIRLYREEQLEAAIGHWRAVLRYDPGHAEARRNIEQAERVLRAFRERQFKP